LAVLREHALFNVFNNHALRGSSSLVGFATKLVSNHVCS
jgi:hypothetical protein